MSVFIEEITYQDIKRDVLKQVRGMEPGKYEGDGTILEIEIINGHYQVKLQMGVANWTFIFSPIEYLIMEGTA